MRASRAILCADDDPDILSLVALRLTRAGYEAITAADGRSALALARERRPAVAVIDVMMPGLTGIDLLAELRADPALRGLKVILLSARVQEGDVTRGLEAGADAYLTKPFRAKELIDEVDRLVADRSD